MKIFKKKQIPTDDNPRITNDTVAEHRELILAGGKKFKYPVQYAKHKLVINTIIIALASVIVFGFVSWWQLYKVQNSNTFFYRLTRIVPLPVGQIDGEQVRFSDYLMQYRSSEHYLQQYDQIKPDSENGKRQIDYIKRKTIDNVMASTYAAKKARELKITVTDKEIDAVIQRDRLMQGSTISQEAYDASALSVLNWSPEEYRQDVRNRLLMQKVSYHMDKTALSKQTKAQELIKSGVTDFSKLAEQLTDADSKVTVGASGMVSISASFGGLSAEAAKLAKGTISEPLKSTNGDGYYFVRVLEKAENKVSYEFVHIPLTAFEKELNTVMSNKAKVSEYITIPKAEEAAKK